jgi:hypothetical protein
MLSKAYMEVTLLVYDAQSSDGRTNTEIAAKNVEIRTHCSLYCRKLK